MFLLGLPGELPLMRHPDLHGDRAVFASEGDLWIGNLKTGQAKRMTSDPGNEDGPQFSPDGTMIAFQGEYEGVRGAYVMPAEGGAPKRLTYELDFRAVTGWTPDGKSVLYRRVGTPTNYQYWTAPVGDGAYSRVPLEFASHVWFGPDNDTYCFTRFNRWYMNWFHYVGGMSNQIWVHKNGSFKQVTNIEGTNEFPVWCGDRIYFVNEKGAKFTVMSVSPDGGKPRVETPASQLEIRELSTDGHRVVYEKGFEVEVLDTANGVTQAVSFTNESDLIHTRPFQTQAQDFLSSASLSPNAKRVFAECRGQIVSLPVGDGEARVWMAQDGARLEEPSLSPDAKKMAFISDESGEQQLMLANPDGTGKKTLTSGQRQIKWFKWSPDSKWIVYYDSRMSLRSLEVSSGKDQEIDRYSGTWFGSQISFSPDSQWVAYHNNILRTQINAVHIYNLVDGRKVQLGEGRSSDQMPAFSSDGKWLAYVCNLHMVANNDPILNGLSMAPMGIVCVLPLSPETKSPFTLVDPDEDEAKSEESKPESTTKIGLDGLYDRRIELPIAPKSYDQIGMLKDRVLMASEGQITYYDLTAKRSGTLTSGRNFQVNKDGTKLLLNEGRALRVVDANGSDIAANTGTVSFGGLRLKIQPLAEWRQIFWDAWRLSRDYFYLENMHGNDWPAIGAKYSALLPRVRSRMELDEIIRWMQSEIGSSHEYLNAGDTRSVKPRVAPAFLGIDLQAEGQYLKISHIVRGDGFRSSERSPLADPALKLKEGMYLLKVAGNRVKSSLAVMEAILGRAGQTVSLTVNDKPMEEGSRTVFIKPVADESRMRYLDWVAANRAYVEKASGGRVGYIHMDAMGNEDFADFVKQYFAQQNKEALVMDDRFNGGGWVQTFVNNILGAKISGYFNMRNSREPWSRQSDAFLGPMCCLINEFAISCGEEFPHRFKDLELGPLIGRRTMGGEIGSSPGWPLVDGGVISVPNYGMYTMKDGWVIEGAGVSPDLDVPSDPNAWTAGKDPQLDAAVKSMLDALKKKPVVWPKDPAPRIRVKKS